MFRKHQIMTTVIFILNGKLFFFLKLIILHTFQKSNSYLINIIENHFHKKILLTANDLNRLSHRSDCYKLDVAEILFGEILQIEIRQKAFLEPKP